jgi:hypothetical protein
MYKLKPEKYMGEQYSSHKRKLEHYEWHKLALAAQR